MRKTRISERAGRPPLRIFFCAVALGAALFGDLSPLYGQIPAAQPLRVAIARFLPADGAGIILSRLVAEAISPLPSRLVSANERRPLVFRVYDSSGGGQGGNAGGSTVGGGPTSAGADFRFIESDFFRTADGEMDREAGAAAARQAGVDFLVVGRHVRTGNTLSLEIQAYAADPTTESFVRKGESGYDDPRPLVAAFSGPLVDWLAGEKIERAAPAAETENGGAGTSGSEAPGSEAPGSEASDGQTGLQGQVFQGGGIGLPEWKSEADFPKTQKRFTRDLGFLAVSIPIAVLMVGNFNLYNEAYSRNASFEAAYYWSIGGMSASIAACVGFAIQAGFSLAQYLASVR